MRALAVLVLVLVLTGCTVAPPRPAPPRLPPGVFGTYLDNDTGAINQSAWAFASAGAVRGNPIEAARAIIALEYLPAELMLNPRWAGMDSLVKQRLELARIAVRQAVGIRPDAPPQLVVNALLAFIDDLLADNRAAALQALASPVFMQPPDLTFQTLSNLPYQQQANLATARVQQQAFSGAGLAN